MVLKWNSCQSALYGNTDLTVAKTMFGDMSSRGDPDSPGGSMSQGTQAPSGWPPGPYRRELSPGEPTASSFACLDLGDGRMVKTEVLYNDPARQTFAPPVASYKLFDNGTRRPQPTPCPQSPSCPQPPQSRLLGFRHMRSPLYPEYEDLLMQEPERPEPTLTYDAFGRPSRLMDNFIGNWNNDNTKAYNPFGCNFLQPEVVFTQPPNPLYDLDCNDRTIENTIEMNFKSEFERPERLYNFLRKDPETPPQPENIIKKRIVAQVKPMRPSYSDVLAKTPKNVEDVKKQPKEPIKPDTPKQNIKTEKAKPISEKITQPTEEKMKKNINKRKPILSQPSSGSESGENVNENPSKTKMSNKTEDNNKKWFNNDQPNKEDKNSNLNTPEFIFIDAIKEEKSKKKALKRNTNNKNEDKVENDTDVEQMSYEEIEDSSYREQSNDTDKVKKKNKDKYNSKANIKSSDKNKRNNQQQPKVKKTKGNYYMALIWFYLDLWIAFCIKFMFWFINLVMDICRMSVHLAVDLCSSMCSEICIRSQSLLSMCKERNTYTQWLLDLGNYIDSKIGHTYFGFWRKMKWFNQTAKVENENESQKKNYTNIPLPSTGEDAMRRLLACKGKDPYSILGVGIHCTDDDIKRYYRRQAFLVHPDKNQQPGAEEAFKILQHAFDMIGEPERREAYEQRVLESRHAEAARSELADLVAKLQEKVRKAASTIRCSGCSHRHPRTLVNRPCYAARYCSQCNIHHSAKEGDIWAESNYWGLVWKYYACMDGSVYQITKWASCQKKNLKHVKADTHHVQYRIVLGNKPQGNKNASVYNADLEDFINNLYSKAKQQATPSNNKSTSNGQSGDAMKSKRKNKKPK